MKEFLTADQHIFVADFAAGENDEVPYFFHNILSSCLGLNREISITVYCTDLHTLRIESLFDKLYEQKLLGNTRVVLTKFESMIDNATFPEVQVEQLAETSVDRTFIDETVLTKNVIPKSCFDIGILNNDVIGYIHEYYKEYTDASRSIEGIKQVMKESSLLIVTQPCLLYPIDNIQVLEQFGFQFVEGFDIEILSGEITLIDSTTDHRTMSRLNHYTFLIFKL
ncbi:MAG: hypothetical protein ACFFF4_10630 [Candidatus Thorarchaeota archaeon]